MLDPRPQAPNPGITLPKRTLSVRVRLMILAIIAVVPLLAERIYNEEVDRSARIEDAYKQALGVARQGAAAQNEVFVAARSLLQAVASARETFNFSDDECTQFVTKIAKPVPWIKTLSVANRQGRIICTSFPEALGLSIAGRPHFKAPLENGGFFLSDYFIGPVVNAPVIVTALAQAGPNGDTAAVVLGLVDLSWFEHVAKTYVPPSGYMLMIDGAGTVLAQYPSHQDVVGKQFKEQPLIREMLARPEGIVTDTAPDGVRRIVGYVQLPGTKARIAVGFDETEVLARVDRAMWRAFAEVSGVALLVLLGIWFGGERLLVRPIHALANTASRIGHGDAKTHATDLPWAAEFVPLAVALDEMARKLDIREQELRDSNDQLRELALIDGLTGLANRRSFNERLASEWLFACKNRQSIAVLMIDVDFFKNFNDHYGHVQGDTCLRKIAGALKAGTRTPQPAQTEPPPSAADVLPPSFHRISARVRRPDFAARFGGEEFAILLQGADIEIAMQVAERLRQGVEDLLMAHAGAPWGFVSISIGAAAALPIEQFDLQEIIESADAALYEAKQQGRNRAVAASAVALSQAG